IAASRPPRMLKYHLAQYAPQATAVPAEQIADAVDLVVLMVPQEELDEVDPNTLAGTILVDATNRWEDEPLPDWFQRELEAGLSSSEAIAAHFAGTRVVKALNHISHWDLDTSGRRKQSQRRGLAVASNHRREAAVVASLIDVLGFEPVILASLAQGRGMEPDGPIFNEVLGAQELFRLLPHN
ncbi:NADPH-dependent F420 reductase, partial [Glutamicibacter creatinolyticus]|uniref:NADPH-dependent F420 reductase n=1 Tax=Glutamicibacter creatinolyticus TaxID=162496 RepID=UPI003B987A00